MPRYRYTATALSGKTLHGVTEAASAEALYITLREQDLYMTVLLTLADGTSIVTEGIWENRFRYVDELIHMGANIQVDGQVAVIEGIKELRPAPLRATDLRAGAAMVVAALAANGVSEIDETIHIERGYENIVEKLQLLGADIRRVEIPASSISRAM